MTPRPEPPGLARWLLDRALPADARDDIAGDLDEVFQRRCAADGPRRAGLWYWAEAISFSGRFLRERLRERLHRRRQVLGDYAVRRARGLVPARWLAECAQDVRVALRQLRRSHAIGAVVVLTLALCIGATTAAYGVVHDLLLAPLPYAEGDRIVRLEVGRPEDGKLRLGLNAELVRIWSARSRTLEEFAAANAWQRYPIESRDGGPPDSASAALVTPSLLPMLRVSPVLGRGFDSDDARPGALAVALLGESIWRSRFGGDTAVIGRAITVNGQTRTVVGVVPRGVGLPLRADKPLDLWLPLDPNTDGIGLAVARLRPGVTSAAASHELQAILDALPDTHWREEGWRVEVLTAPKQVPPPRRQAVVVLLAAAGGLLLIACADIAGLLLIRGWARRREFAIRRALGAWRGRLARQLLTESLLLAVPAGALGLLVAWLALRAAVAVRPAALDFLDTVRLDGAALLWTAVAAAATGLLFGIGPAVLAWERSLGSALRTGGAGVGRGRSAMRAHAALVVGQIAFALMFLATAGVLTRSFVALVRTPLGYEPEGLIEVSVQSAAASAQAPERRLTLAERAEAVRVLRETLAATPGVTEVAVGTLPLTHVAPGPTAVEGPAGARPSTVQFVGMAYVSPEYFRVAGIPLVRGRGLDASPAASAREVVINQALARRLWPDRDALGARLRLGGEDAEWLTVVGVAGDVQMPGSDAELFRLQMYRAAGGTTGAAGSLVLRVRGDPEALRPLLARAVERAGVGVTLRNVVGAESTLDYAFAVPRFAVVLFGTFALLAVALATVGLFAIVSSAVARRTHEIGVRVALGAGPGVVGRLILGDGLRLVMVGCGLGLLGVYAATRTLTTFLYDVSPPGTTLLVGAVWLLIAVALVASAVPMRRALRIDPAKTLRAE